jgi:hypothetical protein
VGVFDDDLARLHETSERSNEAFWRPFKALRCLSLDWQAWYRELHWAKHRRQECGCGGRHVVHGVLIHGRWVLLVLSSGTAVPGAQALLISAVLSLARLLPAMRTRKPRRGGRGPEHARIGVPIWWLWQSHRPPPKVH